MKKAIRYTEKTGFFYRYLKKHVCPKCRERVQMRYIGRFVSLNSPQAAECGFSGGAGMGELRTIYFYCPNCMRSISFEEMESFEKGK